MWQAIRNFLLQPRTVLGIYVLLALVAATQMVLLGTHNFSGRDYTEYNNYVIFKQSFYHLLAGKNMYVLYPDEQWDLYKYSPTFALCMGMLVRLPDFIGLSIWSLANALVLFAAVRTLPFNNRTQCLLLLFMFLELLTSLQNAQSNGLMAGLMIAAYGSMQKGKLQWATLWIVIATFIKVYGAIGFCLFLFYPDKVRFILFAILWTVLLAVLPLMVVSPGGLMEQYKNWGVMMAADQSSSYGLSVMGWLHSWFGISRGKSVVTVVGIVLFIAPFLKVQLYRNQVYRLLVLASMLLWVVIFNHKAESPTFIIAVAGAGIWYFARVRRRWRDVLLVVLFLFTCLSPTDLFPPVIRQHFFQPYAIKVVPCIIVWCVVIGELLTMDKEDRLPATVTG